ncbi:TRAP transporter substrate-binding protein [Ideonella livida]|uniref:TRAP transporter substrate-binding protein n=1 Tax=Ideonella livida TaxID=2707176 RepID=A0A7C9PIK3_9BURK|nr:TRAP transporter substrate-binding protein [Ideonella livida]NDY92915.1 TRAP transporter substrate-binding protein [Ideonella livida]
MTLTSLPRAAQPTTARRRRLLAAGLGALLPAAAGLALPARAAPALTLTLAHGAAKENPRHQAAERFAELVTKGSGGRLQVTVSPANQSGDDTAVLEAVREGRIDITANSQGPVAKHVPEYAALGLPYLFESQYQVWRVLSGPVGKELGRLSAAQGLVVLGLWDNGFRHMSNSKLPIQSPADLKGLRMRIPSDPTTEALMKALGAAPQTVKFSELPAALKAGQVDGQENPLINIYSARLYEVQTYLSLTNHKYETTPLLISGRTWERLSPADRQVLQEAAAEATRYQRDLMLKGEERMFQRLRAAGMKLNYVKPDPFVAATLPVRQAWQEGPTGAFTRQLAEAAEAARKPGL